MKLFSNPKSKRDRELRPQKDVETISLAAYSDIRSNGPSDSLARLTDYDTLFAILKKSLQGYDSLRDVFRLTASECKAQFPLVKMMMMQTAPRKRYLRTETRSLSGQLLHLRYYTVSRGFTDDSTNEARSESECLNTSTSWQFRGVDLKCKHNGRQLLTLKVKSLEGLLPNSPIPSDAAIHLHHEIAKTGRVQQFRTLEALCLGAVHNGWQLAEQAPKYEGLGRIRVEVKARDHKLGHIDVGFSKSLNNSEYIQHQHSPFSTSPKRIYIALGSNVGDRISMIEAACQEMRKHSIKVIRTSALYETEAMYVTEQEPFVNGVCEVSILNILPFRPGRRMILTETQIESDSEDPLALLNLLQSIETALGRVKTIDKGPRNIDLDILLFESQTFNHKRLSIPHKSMLEREFVLRPLCE